MSDRDGGAVYAMQDGYETCPDESSNNRPEVEPSALESAAGHVARSTSAGCQGDGGGKPFSVAFNAFVCWGQEKSLIRQIDEFPFFSRPPDACGHEHEVWFDGESNRWFKATYCDQFGCPWGEGKSATAQEYLSWLLLQNKYFGDDIQLIALVNSNSRLRVVTSQPHIVGDPATAEEIFNWFKESGFDRLENDGRIAWYSKEENLLIADAHEGNIIKTPEGELVPIDLNIIKPEGELRAWANGS